MHLAQIWRYPVKSMAGERLERVRLMTAGLEGDRLAHVRAAEGRVATARAHPALLARKATLGANGEPLIDGRPWREASVEAEAGAGAKLVRTGLGRFDILPLLVATDGAIEAFGHDGRRLRPNLVIGGVDGLAEREWEGKTLIIGRARIAIADLRERCVMTTFDPDTQKQDVEVLLGIRRRFGGRIALNASVATPGELTVGDDVALE